MYLDLDICIHQVRFHNPIDKGMLVPGHPPRDLCLDKRQVAAQLRLEINGLFVVVYVFYRQNIPGQYPPLCEERVVGRLDTQQGHSHVLDVRSRVNRPVVLAHVGVAVERADQRLVELGVFRGSKSLRKQEFRV